MGAACVVVRTASCSHAGMDPHDDATHPKDRVPITEGIVHPAGRPDLVNDHSPTEVADPSQHEGDDPLPRRPTDGPI